MSETDIVPETDILPETERFLTTLSKNKGIPLLRIKKVFLDIMKSGTIDKYSNCKTREERESFGKLLTNKKFIDIPETKKVSFIAFGLEERDFKGTKSGSLYIVVEGDNPYISRIDFDSDECEKLSRVAVPRYYEEIEVGIKKHNFISTAFTVFGNGVKHPSKPVDLLSTILDVVNLRDAIIDPSEMIKYGSKFTGINRSDLRCSDVIIHRIIRNEVATESKKEFYMYGVIDLSLTDKAPIEGGYVVPNTVNMWVPKRYSNYIEGSQIRVVYHIKVNKNEKESDLNINATIVTAFPLRTAMRG